MYEKKDKKSLCENVKKKLAQKKEKAPNKNDLSSTQ